MVNRWSSATLVAFRLSFIYLSLYALATQILGSLILIPGVSFRGFGLLSPMRDITNWVGSHVFHIASPLVFAGNSRDSAFYWVQTFWLLILAIVAAAAWSWFDRSRPNYDTLNNWFRLIVRFALAAQMFEYGMTKLIPVQFPAPSLTTLVTPVGNISLQGLLWATIGSSRSYEIATGCAELLAGILLIIPHTAMLGALICLADMLQVFLLNISYDIGVKLISFHIILLTLMWLAPEIRRLADFFLFNRTPAPRKEIPLWSRRTAAAALVIQLLFGAYLLVIQADVNWVYWYAEGGGKTKSPLYGIWSVVELSIDGQSRPAALNDYDRQWRRVIFDTRETLVFQRIDDSFAHYGVTVDEYGKTIALTKGQSKKWKSDFVFERPDAGTLILDGTMDGHQIHMTLQKVEWDTLRLLNSGFRFVKPPDD